MYDRYYLNENSNLLFHQRKNHNQVKIFLNDEEEYQLIKIGSIPTPLWLEEIESNFKEKDKTKLVVCYRNDEQKQGTIIEMIDIDLKRKKSRSDRKIITKNYPSIIYPGIYFYENEFGSMSLITAYGKELIPQEGFYKLVAKPNSVKVAIDKLEERIQIEYPEIREMQVSIGTEETLHIYLKLPTEPYEKIKVFKYIGSEMTNKEYCLWSSKEGKDYESFAMFISKFYQSDLAKEIIYVNQYKEEKEQEQKHKTRTRLLNHIK